MAQTPAGARHYIASAIAATKVVAAATNATEASLEVTGHGYSVGDVLEWVCGWSRVTRRFFKVKTVTDTDNIVLAKANTLSTEINPAGLGVGTVRKVTTFTEIDQVLATTGSGGEPKPVTYRYQNSDIDYTINDGFTAITRTFEIDADALDSTGYNAALALTEVQSGTCLKTVLRNGAETYLPCTVALNEDVQMQDGQVNRVRMSINGTNRAVRYAAA